MTKRHATNPGVVRERRQKAAIEARAEKRDTQTVERMIRSHIEKYHPGEVVGVRVMGDTAACEKCWP